MSADVREEIIVTTSDSVAMNGRIKYVSRETFTDGDSEAALCDVLDCCFLMAVSVKSEQALYFYITDWTRAFAVIQAHNKEWHLEPNEMIVLERLHNRLL